MKMIDSLANPMRMRRPPRHRLGKERQELQRIYTYSHRPEVFGMEMGVLYEPLPFCNVTSEHTERRRSGILRQISFPGRPEDGEEKSLREFAWGSLNGDLLNLSNIVENIKYISPPSSVPREFPKNRYLSSI